MQNVLIIKGNKKIKKKKNVHISSIVCGLNQNKEGKREKKKVIG